MPTPFTRQGFDRLTPFEADRLMYLQMSPSSSKYGGGGYLPDDCSECAACGDPILGTGWCGRCHDEYERLCNKALGAPSTNTSSASLKEEE